MLLELIAVIAAGFAAAGVVLIVRRISPRVPRWLAPVLAGAAMLGTAISLEYTWFDRTAGALPPGVEVALTREERAPWRPWTYLVPYVGGFIAVDKAGARTHATSPGRTMADLYVFARWTPTRRVNAVFDCVNGRRADLGPTAELTDDGGVEGVTWHETGLDDPVTRTACVKN